METWEIIVILTPLLGVMFGIIGLAKSAKFLRAKSTDTQQSNGLPGFVCSMIGVVLGIMSAIALLPFLFTRLWISCPGVPG